MDSRMIAGRRFRNVEGAGVDQELHPLDTDPPTAAPGESLFPAPRATSRAQSGLRAGRSGHLDQPRGTAVIIDDRGSDDVSDAKLDQLFEKSK